MKFEERNLKCESHEEDLVLNFIHQPLLLFWELGV